MLDQINEEDNKKSNNDIKFTLFINIFYNNYNFFYKNEIFNN